MITKIPPLIQAGFLVRLFVLGFSQHHPPPNHNHIFNYILHGQSTEYFRH